MAEFGLNDVDGNVSLAQLAAAVIRMVTEQHRDDLISSREKGKSRTLPRIITFPYSRHSSYEELCDLLKVFKPKDVWPCTEDPLQWHEGMEPPYCGSYLLTRCSGYKRRRTIWP